MFPFVFDLDQLEFSEKSFLSDKLATAEKQLRNSKKGFINSSSENQTEFTYDLNAAYEFSDSNETIKKGIKFIKAALQYEFKFIPQLERVEII